VWRRLRAARVAGCASGGGRGRTWLVRATGREVAVYDCLVQN